MHISLSMVRIKETSECNERSDKEFCCGGDAYSGTSLAMTLVADEGAKPSPSPTCMVQE